MRDRLGWLAAPHPRFGWLLWLPLATTAAFAIGLFAIAPAVPTPGRGVVAEAGERTKGGFAVGFYIKRGEVVQRGTSGQTVHPGDFLRFTYSSEAPTYLSLLGRDGRATHVYFPISGEARRVGAGNHRPLDFSLELDAQPGTEELFVVSCPKPYPLTPLQQALAHTAPPPVADDCRIEHIVLHKEPPR